MAGLYDSLVNTDPEWVTDLTELKNQSEAAARASSASASEAKDVLESIKELDTVLVWAYTVTEPTSTIRVPDGTTAVPFFMCNGVTHYLGRTFTYDADSLTISLVGYAGVVYDPLGSISTTLVQEAEVGDVLIITLTCSMAAGN